MSERFECDIQRLRARAYERLLDGAVTPSYGLEPEAVIDVLNRVLATELCCQLRYLSHYHQTVGFHGKEASDELLEHAEEERQHAMRVAKRISELGGQPDFDPRTLNDRSFVEMRPTKSLNDMLKEDLLAERIAIEAYREIGAWLAQRDPTTRRMMEELLAVEEEHAHDLAELMREGP